MQSVYTELISKVLHVLPVLLVMPVFCVMTNSNAVYIAYQWRFAMKKFGMVKTILGLSALMVFAPVFAETDATDTFKKLDKNGDGYISINEATGNVEMLKQWVKADKNADGQIEMSEFSAFEGLPATTFAPDDADDMELGAAPTK